MPQMSPYNWLTMNLFFTYLLIPLICMIYFYPNKSKLLKNNSPVLMNFLLKW